MTDTEVQKPENGAVSTAEQQEREHFIAPRTRIVETAHAFVLTAEMPGVGKEGVEVGIENDQLIIIGRRQRANSNGRTLYRESSDANYRRTFNLEGLVDVEGVSARIDNGILRVELHKTEALKPRKIEIQA